MKDEPTGRRTLRELEAEVEAEMRQWGRRRLAEKLQQQADQHGRVFPPERPGRATAAAANDASADGGGRG
jgi:hypothetical protein